jgi:hypothetical protein
LARQSSSSGGASSCCAGCAGLQRVTHAMTGH